MQPLHCHTIFPIRDREVHWTQWQGRKLHCHWKNRREKYEFKKRKITGREKKRKNCLIGTNCLDQPVTLMIPIIKQNRCLQWKHPMSHNASLVDKHLFLFLTRYAAISAYLSEWSLFKYSESVWSNDHELSLLNYFYSPSKILWVNPQNDFALIHGWCFHQN